MKKIKYPVYQPYIHGNEKKYVNDCIDSTWISSKGKYIEKFESEFSQKINVNYSVGVCNGTIALHLGLLTLGIGVGDEVIVPTFTYIASVNSIKYTGAKPVFADSLEDTWQVDPEDIKRKITNNTKAIMPVHLYGQVCDMDRILKIAQENRLFVIEDCAEAFGSKYKNKNAGTFGDLACFSFFGNKTITTGEGGMVVTNDKTLFERAVHLKGQGLAKFREYWHDVVGYNYRMTNIQAALGLAQLEQADSIIKIKRQIFKWYKKYLVNLPIKFHEEQKNTFHTFWMINILTENSTVRDNLRNYLFDKGIETRPTFYPVHTMPIYADHFNRFPVAEFLGWRGINLPSYPDLTKEDVKYISNIIRSYYE